MQVFIRFYFYSSSAAATNLKEHWNSVLQLNIVVEIDSGFLTDLMS